MAVLTKLIYRFHEVPVSDPTGYFVEIDKMILKLICKLKGYRTAKTFFEKRMVGIFTISNFKTSYKATVIKTEY